MKDPSYIYKINDNTGNPDRPSFVFKLSTLKAKIAINMDRDKRHFLAQEFCFFDGKHKRAKGYVTLTASVYHPLLRRQIPFAISKTTSPTLRFSFGSFYFFLSWRAGRYSLIHLFQNRFARNWACLHCRLQYKSSFSKIPGGKLVHGRSCNKWFGVSGSSSVGSSLFRVKGLLFRMFFFSYFAHTNNYNTLHLQFITGNRYRSQKEIKRKGRTKSTKIL